ncbi:PD40 domain-containing protein [Kordiimonas sp. SCSIO 12603]|uniref:hypothetical protein n=1 Tax=Kordiimonas sp. SCSIO 12603 TaxID=2829596 RepID=UPI0021080AB7|nr:hypothetical protein [Kordiimonas sp. SCSIO 12603]UTW57836.1 PD40 domain-containing protein [Kordiimonas sp. SCSIO 12603]
MKYLSASTALLLMSFAVNAGNPDENKPILEGPYLGQTPPGLTPTTFAPGIISTEGWEYGVVFAPNMKELYWVREVDADTDPKQEFVVYEQKNNVWHERVISPRSGTPTLSTDGNTMFFGRSYKERAGDGWSDAKRLGPDFEDIRIMRVTASEAGTIAIDEATREGDGMLRYSRIIDGKREAPIPFPKEINTGQWNAHPFIAPDESYVIWDGQRDNAERNANLFISFKQEDGSWGEAIKFGKEINTGSSEFAAQVTPDGKYLFFNRNVGPDNTDTFWVDAKVIEKLRPKK